MDRIENRKCEITPDEHDMLQRVAQPAATSLSLIETYAICVLLSMAFGIGSIQSRIFASHVNAKRAEFGLPAMTQAVVGSPTTEEKIHILESAMEKLGADAEAVLIKVLLSSPFHAWASAARVDGEEDS